MDIRYRYGLVTSHYVVWIEMDMDMDRYIILDMDNRYVLWTWSLDYGIIIYEIDKERERERLKASSLRLESGKFEVLEGESLSASLKRLEAFECKRLEA